jgi:DDE_Tnp_1-associated
MEQSPTANEITLYYQELQNHLSDPRQDKGKRHELALILTTLLLAILRSVGNLKVSVIHRQMKREHEGVLSLLGLKKRKFISDSQFRRVLNSIDYQSYNALNDAYFGVSIVETSGEWKAIDGKELRGNIDGLMGQKRGENVVKMVSHEDKSSQILGFYNGRKESEKTIVENYFRGQEILLNSYSFDALHTSVGLLEEINGKSGIYLAQVKQNQANLLKECIHLTQHMVAIETHETYDKAHGREEHRKGYLLRMNTEALDSMWAKTGIKTLLVVERKVRRSKNGAYSHELAFFVSNKNLKKRVGLELFMAARGHWNVEADNYVKDVVWGEDAIKCKESGRIRMIASAINNAINRVRNFNIGNSMTVFREDMIFNRDLAIACISRS